MLTSRRKSWDELSEFYKLHGNCEILPVPPQFFPTSSDQVLDLGCGAGSFLDFLNRTGKSVFGMDISRQMARYSSQFAPIVVADAQKLPFADRSFDYIWSRVVFSCLPDWRSAAADSVRVLKPGGRVVILVSSKRSFATPFRAILSKLGQYSEGTITHLWITDIKNSAFGAELVIEDFFGVQKDSDVSFNNLLSPFVALLYFLDKLVNKYFRTWGGDLCIVLRKPNV